MESEEESTEKSYISIRPDAFKVQCNAGPLSQLESIYIYIYMDIRHEDSEKSNQTPKG